MKWLLFGLIGLNNALVVYDIDARYKGIVTRPEEYNHELQSTDTIDLGGRLQDFDFACNHNENGECDCTFGYLFEENDEIPDIACSNTRSLKQSHAGECHYKLDLDILRGMTTIAEAEAMSRTVNGLCEAIAPPEPILAKVSPARHHSNGDVDYHVPVSLPHHESHFQFTSGDSRLYCTENCQCSHLFYHNGALVDHHVCLADNSLETWKYCIVTVDANTLNPPEGKTHLDGLSNMCKSLTIDHEASTFWFSDVGSPLAFANPLPSTKGPVFHVPTITVVKVNIPGTHATRIKCDDTCNCNLIFPGLHGLSHETHCKGSVIVAASVCQLSFATTVSSFERFFQEVEPRKGIAVNPKLCNLLPEEATLVPIPPLETVVKSLVLQGDLLVFRVPSKTPVDIEISKDLRFNAIPKDDGSITLVVPIKDTLVDHTCPGFKVPSISMDTYELGVSITDLTTLIKRLSTEIWDDLDLRICQVTLIGDVTTDMSYLRHTNQGTVYTMSIPSPAPLRSGRYRILSGQYVAIPNLDGSVQIKKTMLNSKTDVVVTCSGLEHAVGLDSFALHINIQKLKSRAKRLMEAQTEPQILAILQTSNDRICRTAKTSDGYGNMLDPLPDVPIQGVVISNSHMFRLEVPPDGTEVRKKLDVGWWIVAKAGGQVHVMIQHSGREYALPCALIEGYPRLDLYDIHMNLNRLVALYTRVQFSLTEEAKMSWMVPDAVACQVTVPGSKRHLGRDPDKVRETLTYNGFKIYHVDLPHNVDRFDMVALAPDQHIVGIIRPSGKVALMITLQRGEEQVHHILECELEVGVGHVSTVIGLHIHQQRLVRLVETITRMTRTEARSILQRAGLDICISKTLALRSYAILNIGFN